MQQKKHILESMKKVHENVEYIRQRMIALQEGGMADYQWNAGGDFKRLVWEPQYPTDAHLVMHLFAAYMDDLLSPGTLFSKKHFATVTLERMNDLRALQSKFTHVAIIEVANGDL